MGVDENIGAHIWNNDERILCNAKIAPGKVGIVLTDAPDTLLFPLWPLGMLDSDPDVISHQREQDPNHEHRPLFFYFNAIRNQKLEKLNYEFSLMLRDKGLWQDFSEKLPLDEWKKIRNPDLDLFRERIEVLTTVFKGRVQERQAVRDFCQRTGGRTTAPDECPRTLQSAD